MVASGLRPKRWKMEGDVLFPYAITGTGEEEGVEWSMISKPRPNRAICYGDGAPMPVEKKKERKELPRLTGWELENWKKQQAIIKRNKEIERQAP